MAGNSDLLPDYSPGTVLTLAVDKANGPFPRELHITVVREITATMSPVLEVTYTDAPGTAPKRAVLKLFDRRLGSVMRTAFVWGNPCYREAPASPTTETAYRRYVSRGKVSKLWDEIEADYEQVATQPMGPEQYWGPTEEGYARYEGALQHQCLSYFESETAVYDKLAHMQGNYIPRMLAHVHLVSMSEEDNDDFQLPSPVSSNPSTASSRVPSLTHSASTIDDEIEDTAEQENNGTDSCKIYDELDEGAPPMMDEPDSNYPSSSPAISRAGSTTSSRVPSSSFGANDVETDTPSPSDSEASSGTASTTSTRATSPTLSDNVIKSKKENSETSETSGRSCSSGSSVNNEMVSQAVYKIQGEAEADMEDTAKENHEDNPFLRVNGVLLDYVPGTPLSAFVGSPPPVDGAQWKDILQDVVNTAEKINRAGVLMTDCRSSNVLLREDTWQPVFLDFAQAHVGDFEDEEADFGSAVYFHNNPREAVHRLVKPGAGKGGEGIQLTYPRLDDLIRDDDDDDDAADSAADHSSPDASNPSSDSEASTPPSSASGKSSPELADPST